MGTDDLAVRTGDLTGAGARHTGRTAPHAQSPPDLVYP